MAEEIGAKAKKRDFADLTTAEYLVIKGKHLEIKNSYLYLTKQTQAVAVKDILTMEYLTIRSKRLFVLFMILMTLVVFGGVGIRKMLSVTKQIDTEVQKIENAYNSVADEDIDISVTDIVTNILLKIGIVGIVAIYIVLILGSVACFLGYMLRPFHVLYISTIGNIIAVERRLYEKAQLDALITAWKNAI